MRTPDEKILSSLAALQSSNDWKRVIEWLQTSQEMTAMQALTHSELVFIYRSQGAALELKEFLEFATRPMDFMR